MRKETRQDKIGDGEDYGKRQDNIKGGGDGGRRQGKTTLEMAKIAGETRQDKI